jgi:serine/threonine protein kinase
MFCPRCHREYEDDSLFCSYDGARLAASRHIDLFHAKPTRHTGEVIAERYAIRGYVGKGSMARVYLAEDLHTHDAVAVKLLDVPTSRGSRAKARFIRESQAANRIGHPNIVKILEVGENVDGAPFIIMEFLHGESLGELLRRDGRVPADMALPVVRQVASGLAEAHRVGVIHRDVKPDNLFLIGEPGDPYAVKILDFGLAKLSEDSGVTASGIAVGTLEYMSPEQVVTDPIDHRSDIYGLGVVMYRIFTGQLPFHAKLDADLLAEQLLLPLPDPKGRVPALSDGISQVIAKATRKRPDNRYESMDHFVDDLDRLLGDKDGELTAAGPVRHHPDEYMPQSAFARHAAGYFYRKIGREVPWSE